MFLSQRGGAGAKGERVVRGEVIAASKSKPTDGSCQRQPIFLCLFWAMKPNQTTSICLFRAIKARPTNFCLFFKSSQTRPVEGCSDSSILKQSEQNFFFCPQACFLAWGCHLLCAPYCLPSPLRLFSGGMILSFFLLFNNPPFWFTLCPSVQETLDSVNMVKYTIWFRPL